ncbi:MAG TPA: FtsX-like permease family protein [Prolixibacteraceae bacterium]|nr:FtsX-like permease family protein [Prolixibacteraceae bacterium]
MNINLYIAKRIFSAKENKNNLSHHIINIALFGIVLGLIVLILSVAIVTGYKSEVGRKVIGFGSHLQIVNLDTNESYETSPVSENQPFLKDLAAINGIRHIQVFATKPGIIRTDEEIQGVVLKGIGPDFDWSFFKQNMVEGEIFTVQDTIRSNKVWVSKQMADLLKLKLGDDLFMFFLDTKDSTMPRQRKFELAGIYKTSLEEFDRMFVLCDINHIRKLNNWEKDQVSGFEIFVDDFKHLSNQQKSINNLLIRYTTPDSPVLQVVSIKEKYAHIFDWLGLLDMNVWVILSLMILVAGFNMVSSLLVIILERTQMIGILKALGAHNWSIRKVFLYFSGMLILKALFWGNLIGIGICLLQQHTHILKLDPASYYLAYVPVNLSIVSIVLLNLGTIVVTFMMLLIPSWFITKLSPEQSIRFE